MSLNKNCKQCGSDFVVMDEDLAFLEKISPVVSGEKFLIPPPVCCPKCSYQRRLAFRNERNLYKRKCDFTGKDIVSIYKPGSPYRVMSREGWWDAAAEATNYGKNFDFNRPFFEQFMELKKEVPRLALITDPEADKLNSTYTNFAGDNKNCYLIFDTDGSADCCYSETLIDSKNCIDCTYVGASEICYECVNCSNLYNVFYSNDCGNCRDSYFLDHCTGCSNCFACSNLIRKEYHIYNKPYSKEEYFAQIGKIDLASREMINTIKKDFQNFLLQQPREGTDIVGSENCSGDYIFNSKNCFSCFKIIESEDLRYCDNYYTSKDGMHASNYGMNSQLFYECEASGINLYCGMFLFECIFNCSDILYSDECRACKNCFGCCGLNHGEYCILNKKYSKEEYEILLPKIIRHMISTGEWGEFFPADFSAFGYNESKADIYFPLKKEEALNLGFNWSDYEQPKPEVSKFVNSGTVPDNIADIPDEIYDWAILCEKSNKYFKISKVELEFYRKYKIPLPISHPDVRFLERFKKMHSRTFVLLKCAQCGKDVVSAENQVGQGIIYCEDCYTKFVA